MAAKKNTKARKKAPLPYEKVRERLSQRDAGSPVTLPEIPGVGDPIEGDDPVDRPTTKVRPVALAYVPIDRANFAECEYDLGEIGRALDTEALVFRSVIKHFTLATKEGWTLTGKNPKTIDYIKKRLFEFELATLQPTEHIIRDVIWNLILFSNAYLVFRRDPELSSGRIITKFDREIDPIAGIFLADPSSMRIRRNRWGEVKRYYQRIEGDRYTTFAEKYFEPEDVLHFHYARKTGLAWGTPYIVPVLDDIRLLRNLEELTNFIAHKGAFPLYQYRVGSEQSPAIDFEDGTSEVTAVEEQLRNKPVEGVWVTPERHEVLAVDATAPIKDLSNYLEYFKARVLAGLNLSSVDVGDGDTANRGTANQMSKGLQYQCKDYQTIVSYTFTLLFDDLLDEGSFPITPENRVFLSFPEIDVESQQLVNNHALAMYQGNAISEDEMRKAMGKEPFKPEQHAARHLGRVQMPLLEMQRQAQASIAAEKASMAAANKNRPANQSGTKGSAGSRANDFALHEYLVGAVNQVVDESSYVLSCDKVPSCALLGKAMAQELLAKIGDQVGNLSGLEALLEAKTAPLLCSVTKDTSNIFLDGIRSIYSAVLLEAVTYEPTTEDSENVTVSPPTVVEDLTGLRELVDETIDGVYTRLSAEGLSLPDSLSTTRLRQLADSIIKESDMSRVSELRMEMRALVAESENRILQARLNKQQEHARQDMQQYATAPAPVIQAPAMPSFTLMVDKMEMHTPPGQAMNMHVAPPTNEIHVHVPEQAPPKIEITNTIPTPQIDVNVSPTPIEINVQPSEVQVTPNVTIAPAVVNVAAPEVSMSPIIQVQMPEEVQVTKKISIEKIQRDPSTGKMLSAQAQINAV